MHRITTVGLHVSDCTRVLNKYSSMADATLWERLLLNIESKIMHNLFLEKKGYAF